MANKNAALTLALLYKGPGDESVSTTLALSSPYSASSVAMLDVPAGTADGTTFSVPFGSIEGATMVLVANRTTQPLEVKINGAASVSHEVPAMTAAGPGVMLLGGPTIGDETPLESVDLITTLTLSVDDEQIETRVFGDPV